MNNRLSNNPPAILFLSILTSIFVFITLFLVPSSHTTHAKELSKTVELGTYYEIFRDPSNDITIEELISGQYDQSFEASTKKYMTFQHTEDTIWLRLDADEVMKNKDITYWLEYDDKIEIVNMYTVNADGSYELKEGGLSNFKKQSIPYHSFLFKIKDPSVKEIYLQLEGQLPLTIFTSLHSNNGFIENIISYKFYTGSFYGFLTALAMYNLFLYFSFKEKSYLYYTLYMFSFMLFQATMNSFDVELLGHLLPAWLFTKTLGLSCNIMVIFMILFGREFLDLKKHFPKSNRLLTISLLITGLSTVALFIGANQNLTDLFITGFSLIMLVFLWICGLRLLLKGHKSARFYMLGWSVLLGSVIIQGLAMLNIIPLSLLIFEEIPSYSAMFEALVLSLATRVD